jgi:PAS domain S-box-containing protein
LDQSFRVGGEGGNRFQVLWEAGECAFCRRETPAGSHRAAVLVVVPVADHPPAAVIERLVHELSLKDELDGEWAVRPLELERYRGQTMLVLEDPGGEPLARLLGSPWELERFLRLAVDIAAALRRVHQHGLIHKDIKPANILVGCADKRVRLTGFGIASRLVRERQTPEQPEKIAGTLAYMAPEQTGRMNRSIDSRSDLYALGITLYQILTGALPFSAENPLEWIHCHIARKPASPGERVKGIPVPVSAIVMKLLAKTPEDRYQTAGGLERDLRRCLAGWENGRRIDSFELGLQDTPSRLMLPEKLYGREHEIRSLLGGFDRVLNSGTPELVLVTGYAGIGKSSVVNEVHKALVPPRGLFASGKFDQYKRDIPYATLVQAFQSLVRALLGKDDAELQGWRDALLDALGPNGQLMVELIPELKLVIGEQPAAPDLPPQQAKSRFQLLFRRFIGVFARAEHPLALFLDDLQWLDAATLDLLEHLLTRSDLQHLLLIGAYRDNEVDGTHPLLRKLETIKAAGGRVSEIWLGPLSREHLGNLIADALRCEAGQAVPLAALVDEKTGGNPFFAIHFLSALAEEDLLTFDHDHIRWSWDVDRIRAQSHTENVVDLMVGKLVGLPAETQDALQQLACFGNAADTATLSIFLGRTEQEVHDILFPACRQELVERVAGTYRFAHDRVQEAAYSRIAEDRRGEAHLRLGRMLAANTPPGKQEEAVFDIVNQLNRGAALTTGRDERERLAELNLVAGKRAKTATAYVSAITYLAAGAALLADDCWQRRPDLAFGLELDRAECDFLAGNVTAAEEKLSSLSRRRLDLVDRAALARLRIRVYVAIDSLPRAIDVLLEYLRPIGLAWPAHPTSEEVRDEYAALRHRLGKRPFEELFALPLMTDAQWRATIEVLQESIAPTFFTDTRLMTLVLLRMASISVAHGHCSASCHAYASLGAALRSQFGDVETAAMFARLALELVDKRLPGVRSRVYVPLGTAVFPWTQPLQAARALLERALTDARTSGDLTYVGFSSVALISNRLVTGDGLGDVQREAENALRFAQRARFGLVSDMITVPLQLVRTLRGLTPTFGSFDDEGFDERLFEERLATSRTSPLAESWYWIRKLQARFFAGDHAAASAAAAKAQPLLSTSPSMLETADYYFYSALCEAASETAATPQRRRQHAETLLAHYRRIDAWAANCPENFQCRAALVGAEVARTEGREREAMTLYEQAIRSAQDHGFVHVEALAYEFAHGFYAARGFDEIARLYLRNARAAYHRWGAEGKVRQLDELHPQLLAQDQLANPTSTIETPVEQFDLETVVKLSQAISSEILLDRLVDRLLRTALSQAGAERGVLVLLRSEEPRIEAEALTRGDTIVVQPTDRPATADLVPQSMLRHVLNTGEPLVINDAAVDAPYDDSYFRGRRVRSALCLPLINQVRLIGFLYFENNLAAGVFVPRPFAVLSLIASQAAIALQNAQLYRDLEQREGKIQRLVDANIIGIFIWRAGAVIEANDTFLRMLGFERDELTAGRIRWRDQTPAEWQHAQARAEEELFRIGASEPFEKEYFRKDGSRVPVLVGSALFDKQGGTRTGVSFVLDLTDRKRAEAEARDSERRYRELQGEMAHASRVATIGQLTGSIAHEVNQPLAAIVTNAQATLRWLTHRPPNLEEVREAVAQIALDATRAADIVGRIRGMIKKEPPRQDLLEINEPIREVIELIRGETAKNNVSVKAELAEGLPLVRGDRVQLQQVILNLMINAIEAMSGVNGGDRQLIVTTEMAGRDDVRVVVRDSGPGLAPEVGERLFQAFYTTKSGGLGMGLSICQSIIEAHGGQLSASANDTRGATFQFALPIPG